MYEKSLQKSKCLSENLLDIFKNSNKYIIKIHAIHKSTCEHIFHSELALSSPIYKTTIVRHTIILQHFSKAMQY